MFLHSHNKNSKNLSIHYYRCYRLAIFQQQKRNIVNVLVQQKNWEEQINYFHFWQGCNLPSFLGAAMAKSGKTVFEYNNGIINYCLSIFCYIFFGGIMGSVGNISCSSSRYIQSCRNHKQIKGCIFFLYVWAVRSYN